MSMDALTSAAFESLVKDVLPKLAKKLAEASKMPTATRTPPADLAFLLKEANELLTLLGDWAAPAGAVGNDISDDDAMALLTAEGVDNLDADDVHVGTHGSMADSLSDDSGMDDDEAMALLTGTKPAAKAVLAPKAQAPAKAAAPAAGKPAAKAPPKVAEPQMEDGDAEMLAMLEAGADDASAEAGGEMSDDDAHMLLAQMDAPAPAADADMSDDEARRLLDEMDAPAAVAPASDGEMSDDEARDLLALMDAPNGGVSGVTAPVAQDTSADDEAMAMLKALGGAEDEPTAPARAPAAIAKKGPPPGHFGIIDEPPEEELVEIAETSQNDFASDPEMMKDFMSSTDDLMETLDGTILQLEHNPRDRETIESIFRAAHTLKGAAGMFGFKAIERVMHRMENLFDQVRKGILVPDPNIIDVVFQGIDVLRTLLDGIREGKSSGAKTVPIVRALELAAKGQYVKGSMGGGSVKAETADGAPVDGGGDDSRGSPKKKKEEQSTIRVDLERLDHLVNLVGELVIDRTRFASIEEEIRTTQPQLGVASNMSETVQLFGRHMNEIHEIIMKIRMVPIGNAFNKFTRVVRDLSRQLGKEIELFIDGEETELDKTLVEQIGDPLIHLIRNSCDHGVEMPEVRTAAGKNAQGKIYLSARQEGNHIIITIEDDGKGINIEAVRKKGIERGLIAEDDVLSDRDIINLIFEAGFSTAEKVTTTSGRGVGMDVVRKQISKLKGLIDIDSKLGKGTTTTIRLPLTLAIVQSLLIEAQGECFAIPLSTVVESVRIKPEDIQRVGDAEVIKRHDKVLPLMHLHETLELSRKKQVSWYSGHHRSAETSQASSMRVNKRKDRLYVVIVGSGDRRFGLVVDQLLHQQEMVIKTLGPVMKNTPCVAGGAVLGNGEVVLVLDIQELEDSFRVKGRPQQAA